MQESIARGRLMKRNHLVRFAAAASMVFLSVSLLASGQQPAATELVAIKKISGAKVKTPEYRVVSGQAQPRSRDWFAITTQYDTAPEWLDELTFSYYVLIQGRTPQQPKNTLLVGEVTYVNIQKGRHLSDMYLHPSTLARYGDVKGIAVIIKQQGRVLTISSEPPTQQRWWEMLAPVSGLVLNRMQTPFAMINFDDYEAIKTESGR